MILDATQSRTDAAELITAMVGMISAIPNVDALTRYLEWPRARVEDAILVAVEADHLIVWPDHPGGVAFMLSESAPGRAALGDAVPANDDANSLAFRWSRSPSSPPHSRFKQDRDKPRVATVTYSEAGAVAAGYASPLDSVPDRGAPDPSVVADHREALEAAIKAGDVKATRALMPPVPARTRNAPGRPQVNHEAYWPDERGAWKWVAHGAAWSNGRESDIPRREQPAGLRSEPITTALPANLRPPGVPSGCPHCHGRPLGPAEYCLRCDASGVDALVGVAEVVLKRQATQEGDKWDRRIEAEAKEAREKRRKDDVDRARIAAYLYQRSFIAD